MNGEAFFFGFMVGLCGLELLKVIPMHMEAHTVGYLIIATVYIVLAFK